MARAKTKASAKPQPLTGKELLAKVKGMSGNKSAKAEACGYYTETKNGVRRINLMAFMNALLEAEGVLQKETEESENGPGRSPSYKITVQANGQLLVGSAYTKQMGLKPGDWFEISLGRKHIKLKQVDDDHSEDEAG